MPIRRFAIASWLLFMSGCFSSGASSPSEVVVPKDPSGLAKCKVTGSASPLVTEWPASEKAHLEGMLSERAVVVSFSGCEMRLLDACRVAGSYRFKRTTIARDTIDIRDADELWAKIPLGAASLEGELEASGRLAVKTTVAGQLRLDGAVPELPEGGACKGATHIVESLSVGTFELVSGGAVGGGVGVSVGAAGAGVKRRREESTLRSAGDPRSCSETSDDAPNPDCSSPLQVFLVPLEHAQFGAEASAADTKNSGGARGETGEPQPLVPTPAPTPTPAPGPEPEVAPEPPPSVPEPPPVPKPTRVVREPYPEPPLESSVEIHFQLPEDGGRWMLLAKGGELLCKLPCVRRVGKNSGLKLQLDADNKDDILVVSVPDDLGYSPGSKVRAVPQPARNSTLAAVGFYGGILGTVVGAALLLNKDNGCTSSAGIDGSLCKPGIGVTVGSGALLIAGGIAWFTYRQDEELIMTRIGDDAARRRRRPSYALELAPNGLSIHF
jgi:hypothetical protein